MRFCGKAHLSTTIEVAPSGASIATETPPDQSARSVRRPVQRQYSLEAHRAAISHEGTTCGDANPKVRDCGKGSVSSTLQSRASALLLSRTATGATLDNGDYGKPPLVGYAADRERQPERL